MKLQSRNMGNALKLRKSVKYSMDRVFFMDKILNEVFNELMNTVTDFDPDRAVTVAKKALRMGADPIEAIEKGLAKGLRTVGERFERGELFLMHLATAAEATRKAIDEVLKPEIVKRKLKMKGLGTIVIGTVEGDIHDIGKSLVVAMLFAAGFNVYDIGVNVSTEDFVKKVSELKPDIVAASALLSTTLPAQRRLIEALKACGIRDKVKVIVGGAPVTEEWAKEIGADGCAEDAPGAVKLVKRLLNIKE